MADGPNEVRYTVRFVVDLEPGQDIPRVDDFMQWLWFNLDVPPDGWDIHDIEFRGRDRVAKIAMANSSGRHTDCGAFRN